MLEYLLKLGELLLKGARAYRQRDTQERRSEFGRNLFECYFRLLDVLETGEVIVDFLRTLEWCQERVANASAETSQTARNRDAEILQDNRASFRGVLREQSMNMARLGESFSRIADELTVLAPGLEREVYKILGPKDTVVQALSTLLDRGFYLVEVDFDNERAHHVLRGLSRYSTEYLTEHMRDILIAGSEVHGDEVASLLDANGELSAEALRVALAAPAKERLEALWACAVNLREIIVENFDLDAVLHFADRRRRG